MKYLFLVCWITTQPIAQNPLKVDSLKTQLLQNMIKTTLLRYIQILLINF
ncbi:MAG: hypothetical protein U5L45_15965 [Saprospiraceae bacterium]|nr:hypothetical protein [Saprospiraceae bacterium]